MMNPYKVLAFGVILSVSSSSFAWTVHKSIDEFTDQVECRLDAPTETIIMSFQADKLYLISRAAFSIDQIHLINFRIDKNEPLEVILRMVKPNLAAVDPGESLSTLIAQFKAGNRFIAQTNTLRSLSNDSGTLSGFTAKYREFLSCRKQ